MEGQALGRVIFLPPPEEPAEPRMPEINLDAAEMIDLVESEIELDKLQIVVGESVRDPILDLLAPVAGALPLLNLPVEGLETRIAEGLEDIGCKPAGIVVISISKNREIAAMLSEDALRFIMLNPHDAVDRSINWLMGSTFVDMISDRYSAGVEALIGVDRARNLAKDLWKDVVLQHVDDGRKEFGQIAERLLYITFHCVYLQMAFQMAGKAQQEMASVMEQFCRLCVAGNYPIGLLCDKRFLVLTR